MADRAVELQPRVSEVLDPTTGEVLSLDAPAQDLGKWLQQAREWESRLREAKATIAEELHRRMDQDASWTIHAEGIDIVGESPGRVEYDVHELREVLRILVEREQITKAAAGNAIKREVTYKPSRSGINKLLKLGGKVAEAVKACERPVARPRRISIKAR